MSEGACRQDVCVVLCSSSGLSAQVFRDLVVGCVLVELYDVFVSFLLLEFHG